MARGSIQKLATGYRVRVELPRDPATGKRRWHTEMVKSKRHADARVAELLRELDEDRYSKTSRQPLGEYLTEVWLPYYRTSVRESTYLQANSRLHKHVISRSIGQAPLNLLRRIHVEHLYADLLASGLKASTVRTIHMSLNAALLAAVKWELIRRNPASGCAPGRVPKRPATLWTPEQTRVFLASVTDPALIATVTIIAATGMRRGEALALQWRDIDLDEGTLRIERTLTRKVHGWGVGEPKSESSRREIAIPASLVQYLRHYKQEQDQRRATRKTWPAEEWVIDNGYGQYNSPSTIYERWLLAIDALELPRIRMHDLRHGAITRMAEAGVPLKVISEHVGHNSISVTADVYTHVSRSMRAQAAAALDFSPGSAES